MTVAELIAELLKLPQDSPLEFVYERDPITLEPRSYANVSEVYKQTFPALGDESEMEIVYIIN